MSFLFVFNDHCMLYCFFSVIMHFWLFRIQMDAIDPEKLKGTLGDEQLHDTCGMKSAMEMVALLEAQLKDLSPNLDSIAEYEIHEIHVHETYFLITDFIVSPG
jgi:hypothetical protein